MTYEAQTHLEQPIRVLYINNAPFVGGAQVTLRAIISRLDRSKVQPYLAIPAGSTAMLEYFGDLDLRIVTPSMPPLQPPSFSAARGLIQTVRELRDFIRMEQIDVVHTNTQRGGPIGLALQWTTAARFVWTVNDLALLPISRALTPFADSVVAVSGSMYQALRGMPRRNVRTIMNGAVVERPSDDDKAGLRHRLRNSLGIPDEALVIGNVSRLDPWKGVHISLLAAGRVMRNRPDVWFVQIGNPAVRFPNYAARLERANAQLPGARGHLLGFREDAQRWYSAFDVFIHTPYRVSRGHTEAFGLTVAEAMGHGLPVIASDLAGPSEIVSHGETGLLIPPLNLNRVAEALAELLDQPEKRRRFGEAGILRQQRLFSIEREVRENEELYAELTNVSMSFKPD